MTFQGPQVDFKRSREIPFFQIQVLADRLLVFVVGMPFYAVFAVSARVSDQKPKMVPISHAAAAVLSGGKQPIPILSDR